MQCRRVCKSSTDLTASFYYYSQWLVRVTISKYKRLTIQMHGSCCLAPACLINRTSCAAFSRKLYRHIRLQINNSFLRRVGLLLKSSGVQTIQAISITRYPLYIAHANIIADIFSLEVKQAIVHLVRSAPRLRAFR